MTAVRLSSRSSNRAHAVPFTSNRQPQQKTRLAAKKTSNIRYEATTHFFCLKGRSLVALTDGVVIVTAFVYANGNSKAKNRAEPRGCVKIEAAALSSPSLIVLMVSVDVMQD